MKTKRANTKLVDSAIRHGEGAEGRVVSRAASLRSVGCGISSYIILGSLNEGCRREVFKVGRLDGSSQR